MSTPINRPNDPNDPSPYAPKWARHPANTARGRTAHGFPFGGVPARPANDDIEPEQEDLVIGNIRVPSSLTPRNLDPSPVPDPRVLRRRLRARPSRLRVVGRVLTATILATAAACYWVGVIPSPGEAGTEATFEKRVSVFPAGVPQEPLRLDPRAAEQALKIQDRAPLALAALPNDAAVAPAATSETTIAPATFALAAVPQPERTAPAPAAEPVPAPAEPVLRRLEADEIALLLKRGQEFVEAGDFASARPVLRRAAEAGNSRAALIMASTFDPVVMAKVQVRGLAPDLAQAKFWYEKARDLGSAEAAKQLARFAGRAN
jgi:hypothetical protein